jgi:hypothetical protein
MSKERFGGNWQDAFRSYNCCGQPWNCGREFCGFRDKLSQTVLRKGNWDWLKKEIEQEKKAMRQINNL